MKNRGAILFFLGWSAVLAVLFLWPARPEREAAGAGLSDPDDVVELAVTRRGGSYALKRTGTTWRLAAPVAAETDPAAVLALVDALAFDAPRDAISVGDLAALRHSLASFGLDASAVALGIRLADGRDKTLLLGNPTPSGTEIYARMADADVVFTLPRRLRALADQPPDAFRARHVLGLRGEDIAAFSLRIPGKPFLKLARGETGAWRIVQPTEAPADAKAVEALAAAFRSALVVSFTPAGASPEDVKGDSESGVTATFADAAGRKDAVVFGRPVPGTNLVYALVRNGTSPVTLPAALRQACLDGSEKLRDLRLFPVSAESLRRVSVTCGDTLYQLVRDEAGKPWRLVLPAEVPADAARADDLVRRVLALRQNDVASDAAGSVRVSVTTADRAALTPIAVSKAVLTADEDFNGLRSRTVLVFPAADVRRISVRTGAANPVVVTYDARRRGWNAKGARADEAMVAKTVAALADVTAASVACMNPSGSDYARFGLVEPAFAFTVDCADDASRRFNLRIGDAVPSGGRYATAGLSDTVFVLSADTVSALTHPLTE